MSSVSAHSYGVIPVFLESSLLFLVVKQSSGYWCFPKGHPELGETPTQSAQRELAEEAGITEITWLPFPPVDVYYRFTRTDGQLCDKTVTLFCAQTMSKVVALPADQEIIEYRWLQYAEAEALLADSPYLPALTYTNRHLTATQQ